jgi:putative bacteriocin precursor
MEKTLVKKELGKKVSKRETIETYFDCSSYCNCDPTTYSGMRGTYNTIYVGNND